jgi:hypothetical protein
MGKSPNRLATGMSASNSMFPLKQQEEEEVENSALHFSLQVF